MRNHVLDNRDLKVVDYLRAHLVDAQQFSIVSAYFSIYGYDLLAGVLPSVGDTRFLIGDPSSVDDLDPGEKDAKAFRLTEGALVPNKTLVRKPLAPNRAEWVKSNAVLNADGVDHQNNLHLTKRVVLEKRSNLLPPVMNQSETLEEELDLSSPGEKRGCLKGEDSRP